MIHTLGDVAMGEIAELICDGVLCSDCNCMMQEPTGFPQVCIECSPYNEGMFVGLPLEGK